MPLSRNQIRKNATAFAAAWKDETSESGEAKSFWDGFFRVFGLERRGLAVFEKTVTGDRLHPGFVDVYWDGYLIAEHKSAGRDLGKAESQAMGYLKAIRQEATKKGEDPNLPRYVAVSDFALHEERLSQTDDDPATAPVRLRP